MVLRRVDATGRKDGVAQWRTGTQRGFALVAVLVVVMLASMVAISLLFRMRAEETAAGAGAGSEQAWAAAMSGVQVALNFAWQLDPDSLDFLDAPELFREQFVFDDGADQWFFTIYSAGENGELRYGLTDEAGKLNINEVFEKETFERLPNLSTAQAQALWDFTDFDDTPEPEGAEQEYYDTLPTPYSVRNGALATVEELLLVRDFTPAIVFGEDANRNGRLDANEDDGDVQFPPDNKDGVLDGGLRQLVTVSSYDLNIDSDYIARTDINDPADPLFTNDMPDTVVQFINAVRTNNIVLMHVSELLEMSITNGSTVIESPIGKDDLPLVLDRLTAWPDHIEPGLININTASAAVLQTLPDVDANIAESIVSKRESLEPEKRRSIAWLYQEDIVDAATFKKIAPYLTARTWQYSFCVIGYSLPSGRYRVAEVSIDMAGDEPVITYLRDITRLGLPFSITQSDSIVRGNPPSFPAQSAQLWNSIRSPRLAGRRHRILHG